ncbi:MAG: hypothetical protein ACI89L_002411 [Phycisphaerales bacterium]|jgi:hypothetical protein
MATIKSSIAQYLPGLVAKPTPKFVTQDGTPVYAVTAEFDSAAAVYHAAEQVRDAGYKHWDLYSPFPIHGCEEAMGIKRTILPFISFGAGITGVLFALALQYYTNYVDYHFIVQGKDPLAWEAYIPVTFELGVLFCAFATLGGMLMLNGLPRWHHPLFANARFLKTSDDRFVIAIEAEDDNFDPETTRTLLESAGGKEITLIEDQD